MSGCQSRVVCRRGVPAGARSHPFSVQELLDALQADDKDNDALYVYAETDAAGRLVAAARLCVRARLAASSALSTAALLGDGRALVLECRVPLAPHAELLVWFDDALGAVLGLPHLTPRDVGADLRYTCRRCAAAFPEPNPLKLHAFLRCGSPRAPAVWREVARVLRPACSPAALETLATDWGRAMGTRGAHRCVFCARLYSRRYGLRIHLRTHTGHRPLRCRHCARAFADPSNLNKHERLHRRGK